MSTSFADLGVSKPVADALSRRKIHSPFPVQKLVIEDAAAGTDVLVQSPTGSGKTLAFGVPIVERLDSNGPKPAALILAPTRELASQIVDEMHSICHARALKVCAVYGGVGINPQMKAVRTSHVVVATPGRLEDLIQRRAIDLGKIRMLVLDEADRMLDMGFKPAVDRIVGQLPRKRQTLFFSATLEGAAGKVAAEYTYKPTTHTHTPEHQSKADISHRFVGVDSQAAKIPQLIGEIDGADGGRTLVFVRTKRGCDRLVKKLKADGVKALAMHGDKSQGQRQKALARFERGELEALVATDVAARGIDVDEITHVINFDIPEDADTYTHRTGRTGRAGATGEAVTFVLADQGADVRTIAKAVGVLDELHAGVSNLGSGGGGSRGGSGNGHKPRGGSRHGGKGGRDHRQGQGQGGGGQGAGGRNRKRRGSSGHGGGKDQSGSHQSGGSKPKGNGSRPGGYSSRSKSSRGR